MRQRSSILKRLCSRGGSRRSARAESLLVELHRTRPGDFSVDESLGLLYAQRGDYVRALPELKAAAKEQPSSDVAHANLGAALLTRCSAWPRQAAAGVGTRGRSRNPFPMNQAWVSLGGASRMDENHPVSRWRAALIGHGNSPGSELNEDLRLDCASAMLAAHDSQRRRGTTEDNSESRWFGASATVAWRTCRRAEGLCRSCIPYDARGDYLEPSEENAWALGEELLRHWTLSGSSCGVRKPLRASILRVPGCGRGWAPRTLAI